MNVQIIQIVLWILGVAVMALFAVIGFLVNWSRGQDDRIGKVEEKVSANMRHTAENYVRGHEIAEVKKGILDLRIEMGSQISDMRADVGRQVAELARQVGELTKAVYQNIGHSS